MKRCSCFVPEKLAEQIAADRLVYIYGLAAIRRPGVRVFFRAGGFMHISAILGEGTLLSNGALRSMAIERTPGYREDRHREPELEGNGYPDPGKRLRDQRCRH